MHTYMCVCVFIHIYTHAYNYNRIYKLKRPYTHIAKCITHYNFVELLYKPIN